MLRIVYAVLIGVVGAGIVHIAILLLLPEFAERDAWSRLSMAAETNTVVPLDTLVDGEPLSRGDDPLFQAAACRFDLSERAVHLSAPGRPPYWSASIYDRSGNNVYSLNDRAQAAGAFDVTVLTGSQMIDLRKDMPAALTATVFVEVPLSEGIVVVRAFVPDPTYGPLVSTFFKAMRCDAV